MKVTDHSPPPSGEVQNEQSCSYTSTHAINLHGVNEYNFTFLYYKLYLFTFYVLVRPDKIVLIAII